MLQDSLERLEFRKRRVSWEGGGGVRGENICGRMKEMASERLAIWIDLSIHTPSIIFLSQKRAIKTK